jgi:hypothetical protein
MLNWDFKKKMGELVIEQVHHQEKVKYQINLYQANCLFAGIYEFKNEEGKDMYQVYNFFLDFKHLKRCLKDGLFAGNGSDRWIKAKLNVYYKDCLKIAELLVKANIKVELYYKESKTERGRLSERNNK